MVVRLFLVLVTVLSLPRMASAQVFTLYDAFTGPLSPVLWAGLETNTNFAVVSNTETLYEQARLSRQIGDAFFHDRRIGAVQQNILRGMKREPQL